MMLEFKLGKKMLGLAISLMIFLTEECVSHHQPMVLDFYEARIVRGDGGDATLSHDSNVATGFSIT